MCTRQSPYEIVAEGSDEGGTSHCIVLYCERYWASAGAAVDEELRRAGKTCCRHRASSFQASKSVGFRRGIPPVVHVCYELFWNWNGVVRFVSQDKGFVLWHVHSSCLVLIVSLWSLSIGVRIIFTTNELLDRIRNFKSNAYRFKKQSYKKNAPQARFLMKQNAPQARHMKQNAPQARIFDQVLMGTLSCWHSMYFIFHKSQLRIFFF